MRAEAFWRVVVADKTDFLNRAIELLTTHGIRYCVVGGQGVNAYAEPVVSLDLDIVIAVDEVSTAEQLFSRELRVERFPHSLNVSAAGSDLRVQIQTDPRYEAFLDRATVREVLGYAAVAIMAFFAAFVAMYAWLLAADSYAGDARAMSFLRTPLWVPQGLMAFGLSMLAIEAALILGIGIVESIASGRLVELAIEARAEEIPEADTARPGV